jgi:thiol-disulfide isomerase/thioredoxin
VVVPENRSIFVAYLTENVADRKAVLSQKVRLGAVLGILACGVVALVASGCSPNVRMLKNEAEVRDLIATADKPVLIDFFKGGCATCMFLDGIIDTLGDEYKGRVIVARFELMRFWFQPTSWSLAMDYRIGLYPTAVLFVKGKEQGRWTMDYFISTYRKALDEVAGPSPAKPPEPVGSGPAKPAAMQGEVRGQGT